MWRAALVMGTASGRSILSLFGVCDSCTPPGVGTETLSSCFLWGVGRACRAGGACVLVHVCVHVHVRRCVWRAHSGPGAAWKVKGLCRLPHWAHFLICN